jgi:hypothetical protein
MKKQAQKNKIELLNYNQMQTCKARNKKIWNN